MPRAHGDVGRAVRHPVVGADLDADRARGGSPGRRPPGGRRCHSMTAPAHRVGDLRDRPPAQDPRRWWTPEWWRISRAVIPPAYRPMIIESNPPRPPLALAHQARRQASRPGPGAPLVSKGPTSESMVLVVVPPKGACRGPMSSALPSHSPGARSTRPAGRAPGTSSGQSGEQPPGPGHHGPLRSRSARTGRPGPRSRATAEPHRARRRACSSPQSQSSASVLPSGLTQTIEHAPLSLPADS